MFKEPNSVGHNTDGAHFVIADRADEANDEVDADLQLPRPRPSRRKASPQQATICLTTGSYMPAGDTECAGPLKAENLSPAASAPPSVKAKGATKRRAKEDVIATSVLPGEIDGGGRKMVEPLRVLAPAEDRPRKTFAHDAAGTSDHAATIEQIIEKGVCLSQIIKTQQRLTLPVIAFARRLCDGDKTKGASLAKKVMSGKGDMDGNEGRLMTMAVPYMAALIPLEAERKSCEKALRALAVSLPVWSTWGKDVRGFGELSLARIIAETGDLSNYDTHHRLWKRMGMAVIDGERQRQSKTDFEAHGYSPRRRSIMFVIGDVLIKANRGELRATYDEYKAQQIAAHQDHKPVVHHKRAQRYIEKRLLKQLWQAWRRAERSLIACQGLPDAEIQVTP